MRVRWRWVAAAAAAAAIVAATRLLPVEEWILRLQAWAREMGLVGALAYGLAYVVMALLFVPGSVLTIGAGLVFGLFWGTLVVWVAATTTAALAFLIARHLARERVEGLARRNPRFAAIDRAIRSQGWKVVALLRLSPLVPFSISNYLYGLTPVPFGPYVLASWLGMLPGTVLYVYLGAAGGAAAAGRRRSAVEWALLAAGLVATVVATALLTRAARRELARVQGGELL